MYNVQHAASLYACSVKNRTIASTCASIERRSAVLVDHPFMT
jgi:hypothetical protein